MLDTAIIYRLLIATPPILFALTIHEFAHAWMAVRCGDATPKLNGRLTLDPLAHLDPVGTLCIFLGMLGGVGFGWAKPVPVTPTMFNQRRRDSILVAVAGVSANLATALVMALLLRVTYGAAFWQTPVGMTLWKMASMLCVISIALILFNLLPIPPLDGSHVLSNLLPYRYAAAYDRFTRIAPFILVALVFSGAIRFILGWPLFHLLRPLLGTNAFYGVLRALS